MSFILPLKETRWGIPFYLKTNRFYIVKKILSLLTVAYKPKRGVSFRMKKIIMKYILVLLLSLVGVGLQAQNIIPKPEIVQNKAGQEFVIKESTTIFVDKGVDNEISNEINNLLKRSKRISLKNSSTISNNQISFLKDLTLPTEGYSLDVSNNGIKIKASTSVGFFYGVQSLLQLLPAEAFSYSPQPDLKLSVTGVFVKDMPRFGYRGVMIDVGRHFFSPTFIKKMIDVFAMYKINTFHWHLTEDQGWRIEIKKYPKLTEVGSIRKETAVGHYSENKFDGKPYGGFYTQEEIKDVVAYAAKKHITIIPEIEMPGHSMAALTAYPELGCTGGPYELRTTWGVEDHIYCPTETTFKFLEDVLTEVMELFPSKYIHIGGDEAPKITWENSQFCQDLMKKEGLKDEHELQSYFIKRIDKFVTSKGRRIIGWDEILEGGLSPNATVMSWRGEEGGIEAAKMKHDVIMTPNSYVYLDYYQGEPTLEPLAIGGFLPLEKVYSFNPISSKLTKDEAKHILGVQGNLWTEYISTPEHAEYMLFPRVFAIAELGWSSGSKDYPEFTKRVFQNTHLLSLLGVNSSDSYLNVSFTTSKNNLGQTVVGLNSIKEDGVIRYTLDGTNVTPSSIVYNVTDKIPVNKNITIKAALFSSDGKLLSKVTSKAFEISKTTGFKYILASEPDKQKEKGKFILTDGQKGDGNSQDLWSGFYGKDFDWTLDLGTTLSVSSVAVGFLGDYKSWIQTPSKVEILMSTDGINFKSVKLKDFGKMTDLSQHALHLNLDFGKTNARFIKVTAKNQGLLPEGHPSAGNPSWIFVDEISVN